MQLPLYRPIAIAPERMAIVLISTDVMEYRLLILASRRRFDQ